MGWSGGGGGSNITQVVGISSGPVTGAQIAADPGLQAAYNPGGTAGNYGLHQLQIREREQFTLSDFGAIADGVTDNTASIQNAINAAAAAGGGTVMVPGGDYAFAGQIIVKNGVWLVGVLSNNGATASAFIATSSSSQIMVGDWLATPSQGYGAGLDRITVNGNGFGPGSGATADTGIVTTQSVHWGIYRSMITNAAGVGLTIDAAQNGACHQVEITGNYCGLSLTNGPGGNTFTQVHCASNTNQQLLFTHDTGGAGYTFGPEQNSFYGCLFESSVNGKNIAELDCGLFNDFYSCLFSANNSITLSDNCVVRHTAAFIGSGVGMENRFVNCQYVGSTNLYDLNRAGSGCGVIMDGTTYIAYTTNVLVADGAAPNFKMNSKISYGAGAPNTTATHVFNVVNSGTLTNVWSDVNGFQRIITDANYPYSWDIRHRGDAGQRALVDNNGGWYWGNGSGAATSPYLVPDNTNGAVQLGGARFTGQMMRDVSVTSVSSAGSSISLNALNNSILQVTITSTGTVTSATVTNIKVGQVITIQYAHGAAGAYVWPSQCRFTGGTAGSSTAGAPVGTTVGTLDAVTFLAVTTTCLSEIGRSTGVPYT